MMKSKDIKKLIDSKEFDHLTVSEFAKIINYDFDVDKWADESNEIIDKMFNAKDDTVWLAPGWFPKSVTYNGEVVK